MIEHESNQESRLNSMRKTEIEMSPHIMQRQKEKANRSISKGAKFTENFNFDNSNNDYNSSIRQQTQETPKGCFDKVLPSKVVAEAATNKLTGCKISPMKQYIPGFEQLQCRNQKHRMTQN